MHRGERIIGNLRTRRRNGTDERALSGIRQPQQADIGQHAQFEAQVALFARLTLGALARSAVGAGLEVDVSKPTFAPLGNQQLHSVGIQIGNHLVGIDVGDDRSHRDSQDDIIPALAVASR